MRYTLTFDVHEDAEVIAHDWAYEIECVLGWVPENVSLSAQADAPDVDVREAIAPYVRDPA